jgi:hypothetical protein
MESAKEDEPEKKTVTAKSRKNEKSTFEEVIGSPVAKQVGRELVRGVFGLLFGTTPRRRTTRRRSIF